MSEPKPSSNTDAKVNEAPKTAKPRPEFSHPALRAMGIRRLRLPSRNWSIFFGVTGLFFGAIYYDRSRRVAIRDDIKAQVEFISEAPISGLELPRKIKVYMAPPPGDQLEITERHWRRNVKPYLTAASVDFEIIDEDKQGKIRSAVAEQIRNERRAAQGSPTTGYTPDELDHKINDKLSRDPSGGIICLGRGAYKEYLAGLQEGWMGPLEEPAKVTEAKARLAKEQAEKEAAKAAAKAAEATAAEGSSSEAAVQGEAAESALEKIQIPDTQQEEPSTVAAAIAGVEPAWLTADEYAESQVDPLFYQRKTEPIVAIRNPHLLGFLRTPQRFYRYMTRREYALEAGLQTKTAILQQVRPWMPQDVEWQVEEEEDWPHKWKQKGLDKNSEWMREFKVDDRIASHLSVYDIEATPRVAAPAATAPTGQDTFSS